MTIPVLLNKIRAMQFQAQFKATSSILENNLLKTFNDVSDIDWIKRPSSFSSSISPDEAKVINEYFKSLLPVQATLTLQTFQKGSDELSEEVNSKSLFNKDGSQFGYHYVYNMPCMSHSGIPTQLWLLNNGIMISPIGFQAHGVKDGIKVCVDINGPLNGPNRFGWDLFIYNTGYWNKNDCSKYNYGCYAMVKKDMNSYFSSLHK